MRLRKDIHLGTGFDSDAEMDALAAAQLVEAESTHDSLLGAVRRAHRGDTSRGVSKRG